MSGQGAGGGEKTEKPTPRKLKEARKEGQATIRSSDLGAWVGVAAAALVLPFIVRSGQAAGTEMLSAVHDVVADPSPEHAGAALGAGMRSIATTLAPLGAVTVAVALGAAASQGGVHFATKAAKPQFKRLNPGRGLKRLFGVQTLWEALKVTLKTAILGFVLWHTVQGLLPNLVLSGSLPLGTTIASVTSGTGGLIRSAVLAGIVLAVADYLVTRRRTMKQLRMSHQEIKQENKQMEGDPHLKGARRSRQIAMSRNRMMSEVANADVVVVNPTHVAVALRYDPQRGAPRVVAKGAGTIAAKIRERATEHRVPMVEDVPLARAIHSSCEIGHEIPADLYTAVAQVLAFVIRLRSRGATGGVHRVPDAGAHRTA